MDIDVINTMGIGKIKIVMLKGEKGDQGAAGADGSSGNYSQLTNKPSLNGVTIDGSHTSDYYALASATAVSQNASDIASLQSVKADKDSPKLRFRVGDNMTDASQNPHIELREAHVSDASSPYYLALEYVDESDNTNFYALMNRDGEFIPSKAPKNHASADSDYGLGSSANYGHVKIENNLNQSSYAAATALSAYQGYLLDQRKVGADSPVLRFRIANNTDSATDYPHVELREYGNDTNGRNLSLVYYPNAASAANPTYYPLINQSGEFIPSKAPTNHASENSTYGLGTDTNYGHVRIIDDLIQSSFVTGKALSAHQGYVLNQEKAPKLSPVLKFRVGNNQTSADINPHAEIREAGSNNDGWNLGVAYVDSGGSTTVYNLIDKSGNFIPSKAPTNHASADNTYGLGSSANYGHLKVENNLTQSSYEMATALSAYQGYLLNQNKAPNYHASADSTYGLGSSSNYGHLKVYNDLNQDTYEAGAALSAYQGNRLKQMFDSISVYTVTTGSLSVTGGGYASGSKDCSKSGYKAIACVGHVVNGTGGTFITFSNLYVGLNDDTVYYRVRNVGTSDYTVTFLLYILYVKA